MADLPAALLRALAEEAGQGAAQGVSLPRLVKRLGLGASVLMRALSGMGDAVLGGVRGPGWVQVTQHDGRWVVQLTEAGRQRALRLPPADIEKL